MKLAEVQPVDLQNYLARPLRQRVHMIGVELEGGWEKLPLGIGGLTRDSSVRVKKTLTTEELAEYHVLYKKLMELQESGKSLEPKQAKRFEKLHYIHSGYAQLLTGELPSPPMRLEDLEAWLIKHYPSDVNETCGMHIHLSVGSKLKPRPITYQRLMVPEYPRTVVEEFKKWASEQALPSDHPIWPRLRGENEFCQHMFYPDEQARVHNKDFDHHRPGCRYTVIHYPYNRLGTVECRLLPMMKKPWQAFSAAQRLVQITNAFLVATKRKPEKIPVYCDVDTTPLTDFIEEYI